MGWTRTSGIGAGDRDRDGDRDRVRDRDRIHLVALKQPDPGLRTPDPGLRTPGSGRRSVSATATVMATDTDTDSGWMEPVTGVPPVPFSGNSGPPCGRGTRWARNRVQPLEIGFRFDGRKKMLDKRIEAG